MSTTPRTDAIEERNGNVLCGSANLGFARTLERELAATERLRFGADADRRRLRAEVEKWQSVAAQMSAEREHNANEAGRLRAEVERLMATLSAIEEDGTSEHNAAVGLRQNLVAVLALYERAEAELARLRAEVERLTVACNNFSNAEIAEGDWKARAERAEVERDALAAEREKVRVLRSALERRHDEQSYYCQYVEDALAATKEGSK